MERLAENPLQFALAPESCQTRVAVRNLSFKTPRGRPYRLVYVVSDNQVKIVRILGWGHDVLAPDEF